MAKPFSPEKSKLFNYQSIMKKKRELLDKLKDIERKVRVLKQLKLIVFFRLRIWEDPGLLERNRLKQ